VKKEQKAAYMKAWRAKNAARVSAYSAAYKARPESRKREAARQREYHRKHPEQAAAYRARKAEAIRAYDREYQKGYRRRRPELGQVRTMRRLARKRALPDSFDSADWARVVAEFGGRCAYCFRIKPLEQDHLIPLCAPDCPGHVVGNVVPSCRSCNARKGGRRLRAVELLGHDGLSQVAALVRLAFPNFPELAI
jgi:5-methylcytosine-specific restriction endonuclease McrA